MKRGMEEKDEFIKGGGKEEREREREREKGAQRKRPPLQREGERGRDIEKEKEVKKEMKRKKRVLGWRGAFFGVAGSGGINRSKGKLFGRGVTSRYLFYSHVCTYTHMCMRFYLAVLGDVAG